MIPGVDYIFNLTIVNNNERETNQFEIEYVDPKIAAPKTSISTDDKPKISILLLSPERIYADMEYIIIAEITLCSNFSDYKVS